MPATDPNPVIRRYCARCEILHSGPTPPPRRAPRAVGSASSRAAGCSAEHRASMGLPADDSDDTQEECDHVWITIYGPPPVDAQGGVHGTAHAPGLSGQTSESILRATATATSTGLPTTTSPPTTTITSLQTSTSTATTGLLGTGLGAPTVGLGFAPGGLHPQGTGLIPPPGFGAPNPAGAAGFQASVAQQLAQLTGLVQNLQAQQAAGPGTGALLHPGPNAWRPTRSNPADVFAHQMGVAVNM